MKILVLGASGMLGSSVIRVLSMTSSWQVYGTVRSECSKKFFSSEIAVRLLPGLDVDQYDTLMQTFIRIRPDVVINCVGLIKQSADADDPLLAIPINSLLPHRLSRLCELTNARLVHISTDCVFAGDKGGYRESDPADAQDLYGRSKFLGEVACPHAVTLRTSIIGHQLTSAHGLLEWFLLQQGQCKGFTRTIFSGLPTVVLAKIIRDVLIPRTDLHGVYHVAAEPISKYDLLKLIANVYGKPIEIVPDNNHVNDRSLNADRFRDATGYITPGWPELVRSMHAFR
ncbi:SDR family oxidoreductase [Burkholderiales bacterium]|nr:SDR family oxidoreductase [Burkholderiales bacterium]